MSGHPHVLSNESSRTRHPDLSKTRFKTEEQEKWVQLNTTTSFYDNSHNVSEFDIDNSGSILPTIRRYSIAMNHGTSPKRSSKVLSQSPKRSKLLTSSHSPKACLVQQLKNVSLKENRLIIYK